MTLRPIVGLLVFNLGLLVVGASVLSGLRGRQGWADLLRLAGLAYLLGVATFVAIMTIEVVLGVPFGPASVLTSGGLVVVVGTLIGRVRRGRTPRPERLSLRTMVTLPAVLGFAALALYFISMFRAARLAPAFEWDGWWVWTIRAKALYFYGDLGGELVGKRFSDYPSYPPGLSLLYAGGFESMGSVDTVTLHLQNWFLAVGFAAALVGLLAGRVGSVIALASVLVVTTMPGLREQATLFHADALLAYEVAIAVVLLLLWLSDKAAWQCIAASVLLVGALLTKRDAILFVGCVIAACFVASWWERRWAWPRLTVLATGVFIVASVWWLGSQSRLDGAAPSGGVAGLLDEPGRFWSALALVVAALFDVDMWSGIAALTVMAVLLALGARLSRLVTFAMAFTTLSVVGIAGVIAAEPNFELTRDPVLNPVDRLVLVPVVALAVVTALLLDGVWRSTALSTGASPWVTRLRTRFAASGSVAGLVWLRCYAALVGGVSSLRVRSGVRERHRGLQVKGYGDEQGSRERPKLGTPAGRLTPARTGVPEPEICR